MTDLEFYEREARIEQHEREQAAFERFVPPSAEHLDAQDAVRVGRASNAPRCDACKGSGRETWLGRSVECLRCDGHGVVLCHDCVVLPAAALHGRQWVCVLCAGGARVHGAGRPGRVGVVAMTSTIAPADDDAHVRSGTSSDAA